jgi:hypothetical protein
MSSVDLKTVKELKKLIFQMAQVSPPNIILKGVEVTDVEVILPHLKNKAYKLLRQLAS